MLRMQQCAQQNESREGLTEASLRKFALFRTNPEEKVIESDELQL